MRQGCPCLCAQPTRVELSFGVARFRLRQYCSQASTPIHLGRGCVWAGQILAPVPGHHWSSAKTSCRGCAEKALQGAAWAVLIAAGTVAMQVHVYVPVLLTFARQSVFSASTGHLLLFEAAMSVSFLYACGAAARGPRQRPFCPACVRVLTFGNMGVSCQLCTEVQALPFRLLAPFPQLLVEAQEGAGVVALWLVFLISLLVARRLLSADAHSQCFWCCKNTTGYPLCSCMCAYFLGPGHG